MSKSKLQYYLVDDLHCVMVLVEWGYTPLTGVEYPETLKWQVSSDKPFTGRQIAQDGPLTLRP